MVSANEACSYREPEKQIISRAGDECVVAVWYVNTIVRKKIVFQSYFTENSNFFFLNFLEFFNFWLF